VILSATGRGFGGNDRRVRKHKSAAIPETFNGFGGHDYSVVSYVRPWQVAKSRGAPEAVDERVHFGL
jgi:hypothetical protein